MSLPANSADASARPAAKGGGANRAWLRALEMTSRLDQAPERLLSSVVGEIAAERPDAPALLSDHETLTYAELAERSRRWARWALAQGVAKGEVVALMAPNSPSYMAFWLGVTSVGVVAALLNTNLRGAALAHCLAVAEPKHVVLAEAFANCAEAAPDGARVWPMEQVDLAAVSGEPLTDAERQGTRLSDPALLIYTSGTTGLPKAARVSHHRIMSWSGWFAGLMDASPDDRLYDCLPMYHSVGGVVATGALLIRGGSVVLREKFSASQFWDDIVRWDCTLFQYIGELCRYLLAAPPSDQERAHRLRMICGNGLRPDVWAPFQERFAIPKILEFYAATEGNFSLYNVEGEVGAIGRIPGFMAHRFPAALVRHDVATGLPARGEDGLCQRCAVGEPGEAIGRLAAGGDPAHRFEGYTSAAESEKKILRDVFEPGDAWLRTGDLMRQDARGFWYFVDRIGDTFRWKGENVATTEVAEALSEIPGVIEATVYGVAVPGADGKAGMAALVTGEGFDLSGLRARLAGRLPAYAQPVFLRLSPALAVTETFKQKKADLAKEGFDPAVVAEPLFVALPGGDGYAPLDAPLFDQIAGGRIRL
ncbi:long-chain-acyl-CoA synthetase [Phenylobacterium montanum]|uniref:Long-chain-acyl-CoA synthetase n=1 Tax=Phenylobacterium montanum TaxID=2823693 RepID=A0A975IWB4_9CAUL|nr:long-chain-acyl-CoA synthetase [Caulobacter sp. S6]QUD88216.1 long-chain-acyl-CoA synthetase [Caulobacter sp. S6]